MMKCKIVLLFIALVSMPCHGACETYLASDTGMSFSRDANLQVLTMNNNGDFVLQMKKSEKVYLFNQSAGTASLLQHELYGYPNSVALSDDGKIARLLSEGDEDRGFVLITDFEDNEIERYAPADLTTDDLEVAAITRVFFLPDNKPGALAVDGGDTIYNTTYIVIPSLSNPEVFVSSFGFSFSYAGTDFDGSVYVTNCLVSGHSSCAIYRIVDGNPRKLIGPKGSSGSTLSKVNGVGSYFAYPYPYGVLHYYRKKGEGDYAVYKVALKKPNRYFKSAEISTVSFPDFNSQNILLNINVRFRSRRLHQHAAIGSAHNPNIRRRVKLLSRITRKVPAGCKLAEALKIDETGHIVAAAMCKEGSTKIKKVLLLTPQERKE